MMGKFKYIGLFLAAAFILAGCSSDDKIKPDQISDLRAEPLPGAVKLEWQNPEDPNYHFVECTYYDPWTQENVMLAASEYSDTILVENMLNKYGEYKFNLCTVSSDGTKSPIQTITAQCLPRPADIVVVGLEQVQLTESMLSANSLSGKDDLGSLLRDTGDKEDFFQSQWSNGGIMPAWIQIDLPEPLDAMAFWYQNNIKQANANPQAIELQVSNDGVNFETFATIDSGLPKELGSTYMSPDFIFVPNSYKYIRYTVTKGTDGKFFALYQLKIYKALLAIDDPENVEP